MSRHERRSPPRPHCGGRGPQLLLAALLACVWPPALAVAQRRAGVPSGDASTRRDVASAGTIERGAFRFDYDERGISGLGGTADPWHALLVRDAPRAGEDSGSDPRRRGPPRPRTLTLHVVYRAGSAAWTELPALAEAWEAHPERGSVTYRHGGGGAPVTVTETFRTDGRVLDWIIDLASTGRERVTVGDLGIEIPAAGPAGPAPRAIFERGFLRHQFVEGDGSFFFYTRASGAPPYLMVTPLPGTRLEYFTDGGRTGGTLYVHSAHVAAEASMGTWRQENTSLALGPRGSATDHVRYGFRFRWADSYDEMRRILYEEGLFDIRVAPGMTVPRDLTARFSLHTRARIDSISAEFPDRTTVRYLGEPRPDVHVYEVAFARLGENMLTIHHDGGRETYLEFFSTEPLETLIRKRAAFLVARQQIRDTTKWWDGVFGPYDMKHGVTRTIDDPDIFVGRMVYVLTCDDPGLGKAPYLAAKNVIYPDSTEIRALEYYLEHFVWGKLQRTDREEPYPYGVYGTPNWYINRSPARRAAYTNRDLDREHVWRSYDYPHVIKLYYHMYQIAKRYPGMSRYLDAAGYLKRAFGTAKAFFTYPYAIYPDYYETYKWGLYNELIVLDLIDALEAEGFRDQAAYLRAEWEKKVKYFVYDDEYPLRSEYAFDRTAFESSYALAKYGATHDMPADELLWWDVQKRKWYSHPLVRREDARAFMDRQLAGNLAVRGWLETSYYQLGADPSLSYMAAMGGWGVLDYGIDFAPDPADWLQLGYASYLSSWSLMNTGTPESNYGFWYPGKANDGAAGWQFMAAQSGRAWMGSSYPGGVTVPRGPWYYDGEIDLGFGAALRMARTLVTEDPTFGWIAYGATWTDDGAALSVVPRDGVRMRFDVVLPDPRVPWRRAERLKLELDRDGFARGRPIEVDKALGRIAFTVENRTGDAHPVQLSISMPYGTGYTVMQDGKPVALERTTNWDYPWRARLTMTGETSRVELVRTVPEEAQRSR